MKHATQRLALSLAAALMFLCSVAPAFAAPEDKKDEAPIVQNVTLIKRFEQGGPVMYILLLCSIATVYLVWEGVNRTALKKVAPAPHEEAVKNYFRQGDYTGAYDFCKTNPSPMSNVLRVGISMLGEGKQLSEEAMIGELHKEQSYISNFISYLSVMGVCTPMIGLLGTVMGMIKAFQTLGQSGIGDPSKLSAAIGEVLIATASGLFLAIPAFMFFYFMRNRMAQAVHHIQDVINDLYRKMPWDALAGAHIGDEELYAALPAWAGESHTQTMTTAH